MKKKLIIGISSTIIIIAGLLSFLYIKVLPDIVSNSKFISFVQKEVKNMTGADLSIEQKIMKVCWKLKILTPKFPLKIL